MKLTRAKIEELCTPKTVAVLAPLITPEAMMLHTVSHEFFHPAGLTQTIFKALGTHKHRLEEGKATIGGIIVDEWHIPTPKHRLELVAMTIARILRFYHQSVLTNPFTLNYVKENFTATTCLSDCKMVKLHDNGWHVDLEMAKTKAWFEELMKFIQSIIKAYRKIDIQAIKKLEKKYCD